MYSFSYLEPVCCFMSTSNCCFLTCILVSEETGQLVWYSHLFQNSPQFIVIHTVKGLGIVKRAAATAAAKSLQSCPTPSDPIDCSLPGSSVHGILQARILEWGAIAFSGIKQKQMFFWNSLVFSMIQQILVIWSLVPLPFLKPAWTSGSSRIAEAWLGEFWALLY